MRETDFIKQNKEKWEHFDKVLKSQTKDPNEITRLFIEITEDLSYSRTFYKNRSVRVYLNNIAQQIFSSLYRNRTENFPKKFMSFWRNDVPAAVYESRIEFLISFLIFALALLIGVFSSANDPEFVNQILGDGYVQMTLENIEKNDPMAVYKKMNEVEMFLGITINNLRVAYGTFALGIVFAIGTIAILFYNGIMVGAFQYFFIERGLFVESFLTIWMHGTLEISAIIIAGAAGIVMGKGLVFPGTYSRIYSFQLSAKRGIKIMLSITPIFVFAAFIEGFLTRYTELPDLVRLMVILLSLAFIVGYYVIYPFIRAKQGFPEKKEIPINFAKREQKLQTGVVRSLGQIFYDVFSLYRIFLRKMATFFLPIAFVHALIAVFIFSNGFTEMYGSLSADWVMELTRLLFDYDDSTILPIAGTLAMFANLFLNVVILDKAFGKSGTIEVRIDKTTWWYHIKRNGIKVLLIALTINLVMFLNSWISVLTLIMIYPVILLWMFTTVIDKRSMVTAYSEMLSLLGGSLGFILGLNVVLLFICAIFTLIIDSPLVMFYMDVLNWNFLLGEEVQNYLFNFIFCFTVLYGFHLIIPILIIGNGILFHSIKEIAFADQLMLDIEAFGKKKKVYGISQEE